MLQIENEQKTEKPERETEAKKDTEVEKETEVEGVAEEVEEEEEEAEAVAEEIVEEEEEEIGKGYVPHLKPELAPELKRLLKIRAEQNRRRPAFRRQDWFRFKRLGTCWRRPRGRHSKQRRHFKYRPPVVSIGYRSPTKVRHLHPSGFQEVRVTRVEDLDKIDAKTQAVRIAHSVGGRKRRKIIEYADELGIRVLNP